MSKTSQSVIPLDIGEPASPTGPARIIWRTQYDPVRDALEQKLSDSPGGGDTLTVQHMRDECDINIVLQRMGVVDGSRLPALDFTKVDPSYYGDFTNAVDLRSALESFPEAETRFNELPAALRARFSNNWYELHEWVNDPKNLDEAISLKMLTPPDGWVDPSARPKTTTSPATTVPAT